MKRLASIVLLSMSLGAFAGTGDTVPLCPEGSSPDCVVPNWGQTEPDATDDASLATADRSLAAARVAPQPHRAVQMMSTVTTSSPPASNGAPIKSVVSPQGLFPKETAALLAALKRARFQADGSIKSGEPAIRRAAAAAAKQAGNKYTLTLYIKVPQKLAPDRSMSLGKKVDALNAVLGNPSDGRPTGSPKT